MFHLLLYHSTTKCIRKHRGCIACIAQQETSTPQRQSQELIPGVTNPVATSADDETNNLSNLSNVQVENGQNTIVYTKNPIYESLAAGSHTYKEANVTIVPIEAKRNEETPSTSTARNIDTLHSYLDQSMQSTFIHIGNEHDTVKYTDLDTHTNVSDHRRVVNHMYDTLSPSFEIGPIPHQPAVHITGTNSRISQSGHIATNGLQVASSNVQSHKICTKTLNAKPCGTYV